METQILAYLIRKGDWTPLYEVYTGTGSSVTIDVFVAKLSILKKSGLIVTEARPHFDVYARVVQPLKNPSL